MNLKTRVCLECGEPLEPSARAEKQFCCNAHKDTFNNRRKNRGAELYDLFMAMRYDRKAASIAGVWAIMCRMASMWKEEDDAANVRSFLPIKTVVQRNPKYTAIRGRVSKPR